MNDYMYVSRERQLQWLHDLASEFNWFSDDPSCSAQERVDYYCEEFSDTLPEWFGEHDKELLVRFVGGNDA